MLSKLPRIGFIGVGLMGHGMAKNLVMKGFQTTIMGHKRRAPVTDLVKRGAREVKSPAAVAKVSDILFLCVTSSVQVEQVVRGKRGIRDGAHKGLIVVDTSTSEPDSTLALAAELKPLGVRFVDAPLTRTPKEAELGKLNTFVGADARTFREIRPALEAWAENVFHVGPVGAGHKLKLVNNFIAMGFNAVIAEALVTARKSGVDLKHLHDVISAGILNNGFYQNVMKWVLGGDRNSHPFTLVNCRKDVRYYNRLAESANATTVVAGAVKQLYEISNHYGYGEQYLPHLFDAIADLNRVEHG